MSQQFLQAEDVTTEHEIAYRECVPEDVSADTLALYSGATAQTLKQHLNIVNRQRLAAF